MGSDAGAFSFSQAGGASQAFDFNITESQLNTQVDFSFLEDFQSQGPVDAAWADEGASQVR